MYYNELREKITAHYNNELNKTIAEINNPEYYESPKYTRWAVDTDEDDADDYTEEIATAIIRERDGLGVDAFDNLIKLYFNKYM